MSWYYFETRCPNCNDKKTHRWKHGRCSSYEKINENGEIECEECGKIGIIEDMILCCVEDDRSQHDDRERIANLIRTISLMPEDGLASIDFVNKIIQNILTRCSKYL